MVDKKKKKYCYVDHTRYTSNFVNFVTLIKLPYVVNIVMGCLEQEQRMPEDRLQHKILVPFHIEWVALDKVGERNLRGFARIGWTWIGNGWRPLN